MNYEMAQRVKKERRSEKTKQDELRAKAEQEKFEEAKRFIETRKIFADLLEGREDLFKQCREFLILNTLIPEIGINDLVDAKFAAGYRLALETIEAVAKQYKTYLERYEELRPNK